MGARDGDRNEAERVVAVVASEALIELLSLTFGDPARLVTPPRGSFAKDVDGWIEGMGPVRAVVVEGLTPVRAPGAVELVPHSELDGVRSLARVTRVVARQLVGRRSGAIVCVLRHPMTVALPNTVVCEAMSGFIRSTACDLAHYGVSIFGVVVAGEPDGSAESAARWGAVGPMDVTARLVRLLTTDEAVRFSGEVYLVTRTELGRLVPPATERELVRSDRGLRVPEVARALALGLEPTAAGCSESQGLVMAGRVAIVTGGGGGIGRAVATALAAEGAAVVVADLGCDADGAGRDPGPAQAVAREIEEQGGRAVAACVDVSQPDECQDLVDRAIRTFGRVDALCHAAGVVRQALVFEFTDEDWDAVFDVHVRGAQNVVQSCLEPMRRQGYGRIVLFSSRSVAGSPGHAVYAASKGTILALGRCFAHQTTGSGVCLNIVLPSGRTRASMPGAVSARRRRIELMRARHHGITDPIAYRNSPDQDPENNAAMISWLCSEAASSVNGRIFSTGGWKVELYRHTAVANAMALPEVLTTAVLLTLSTG